MSYNTIARAAHDGYLLPVFHGNVPHHADKTALVDPARRADGLLAQVGDVAVGTVVEYASTYEGAFTRRGLRAIMPRPNNRLRGGLLLGNAQAFDPERVIRLRERDRKIRVWINDGRRRSVWLPVVTYRVRGADVLLTVITGHAVRKRLDPGGNKRTLRKVDKRGRRIHRRTGRPVLLGMDANDAGAAAYLREKGWTIACREGVDLIAGLGVEFRDCQVSLPRTAEGPWSDHPLLTATAVVPYRKEKR